MVVLYLKLRIKDLDKSSHQLFFESDLLLCALCPCSEIITLFTFSFNYTVTDYF